MVTRTINQLHFEDLDPIRFEELILSMVYRMRRWLQLDHLGKKGSDDGIDIRAVEELENGKNKTYYFQCKRYCKITKAQLHKIVDDFLDKNTEIPDVYTLVISCPLSKKQIDDFENYAKNNGFTTISIWTNSIIECKLYAEYQDLLFAYFGVNLTEKRNRKINSMRRNIVFKKRMHNDFLKSAGCKDRIELDERLHSPMKKFNKSEVLIRSIDDSDYPDNTLLEKDFTGYFKAEVYNFYHNGLQVIIGVKDIKVRQYDEVDNDKFEVGIIRVLEIGYLPFDNIIDYDYDGDEYYMYPHLYCDFINRNDPFEKIGYAYEHSYGWMIVDDDLVIRE
ncbi:restriction endonuclease [Clostridium aciditolerans]|uniref:Restriction endonuclease n=1 Tax=Clostridium aciditolerans TaxID=339861 RepID=A0A934HZM3_9CLOT|nr:restriction endonuclease [Clostridium aciditolerans]MBI6873437.1 restriction endonuclease [Clostridium aciditolerans]